jgi:hypothetical protein
MNRSTLLIAVFCLIDDWVRGQRVCRRGPAPILYDRDTAQRAPVTIEVVGAFFGLATDEAISAFASARLLAGGDRRLQPRRRP